MDGVSVLILTHNEEKNIGKCLESVRPLTRRVFIVDSGSTDRTVEIARSHGAEVAYRPWTTYADQLNWGLDHFEFGTDWIMRLDADEELTPGLVDALSSFLEQPPAGVAGVYVRRRVYFMGRWIRHGGYYPTWLLRMFRSGVGRCEALWMDEHIVLSRGDTCTIPEDIIDHNNKDVTFWTDKHNKYSSREVLDLVASASQGAADLHGGGTALHGQARLRRWLKINLYGSAPLFIRPFAYFIYRYVFRLGFLDGKEGFIFHFLQGCWYRFLVDVKLYEHRCAQARANASEKGTVPFGESVPGEAGDRHAA